MNNNNTMKYTLIPIYDHDSWENNLEPEDVIGYIVSTCNIIKEIPSRIAVEKNVYEVSIPSLPKYLFSKKINYITKDRLFNTYDEVKKEQEKLNIEILIKQIESLQQDQNYEINKQFLIQEYIKKLHQYQEIENQIQTEEKHKTLKKKIKLIR